MPGISLQDGLDEGLAEGTRATGEEHGAILKIKHAYAIRERKCAQLRGTLALDLS